MPTNKKASRFETSAGSPHPIGATLYPDGVNFSLFSQNATKVELLLFNKPNALEPYEVVELNREVNFSFHFWHIYVKRLKAGTFYAWRVDGPNNTSEAGHRFYPKKILLDPYAKAVSNILFKRDDAIGDTENLTTSMRAVVVDTHNYDWQGDKPLHIPMEDTIIYELHVGGFTKSKTSHCRWPGSFYGVVEKIPYLKQLGVTAVELLPVFDFDDTEIVKMSPDGKPLKNFWGYHTLSYFAPENSYCVSIQAAQHLNDFRDMVKALHKAGIEVILDVVFNHTGEGDQGGPIINFKGLDNSIYYHLVPGDKQYYMNYSGCGNSVNANHPIVSKFILDCLRFWVREMHVDGFRFDEASILARDENGNPVPYPPLLWNIELDDVLANTKIIAEAWDAAGLCQVGYFPGLRWAEWNGRYRDTVRRFVRGDAGQVADLASRIAGSADLYEKSGRLPISSVNFITCHDGFTMNDLASFTTKHNEANGDNNSDGIDENYSYNCGAEGTTDSADIERLRRQQIKNYFTILMLSRGVPMMLSGDEFRRTQLGNNNSYCQDNELGWLDWSLVYSNRDILRYFKNMIDFRKAHAVTRKRTFLGDDVNKRGLPEAAWHGCKINSPGWDDPSSHVLAITLGSDDKSADLFIIMNMDQTELEFEVPVIHKRHWHLGIDTGADTPRDIYQVGREPIIKSNQITVKSHAIVVMVSK